MNTLDEMMKISFSPFTTHTARMSYRANGLVNLFVYSSLTSMLPDLYNNTKMIREPGN